MKEYGHSLNRFTGKYANTTRHIYSPTKILHLSNFDDATTEEVGIFSLTLDSGADPASLAHCTFTRAGPQGAPRELPRRRERPRQGVYEPQRSDPGPRRGEPHVGSWYMNSYSSSTDAVVERSPLAIVPCSSRPLTRPPTCSHRRTTAHWAANGSSSPSPSTHSTSTRPTNAKVSLVTSVHCSSSCSALDRVEVLTA